MPDDADTAAVLAQVVLLAGADAEVHRELAAIATTISFAPDTVLVRQGEPGDALYVIVTGQLDVLLERADGAHQLLGSLGAGECVGEMALLTKNARSATVIARTAGRALRFDAADFGRILARHPALRAHVVAVAQRRLPSLRLAASGLFAGIDVAELRRFDNESNLVRVRGGEMLVRQGDQATDMFVVLHGSLEVIVTGRSGRARLVDVLGPGSTVGEMALLSDAPRTATVCALRDSELVRVSRAEFLRLVEDHPHMAMALARTLIHRLQQTTATPDVTRLARTVALVPAGASRMVAGFALQLERALRDLGVSVLRLSSEVVDSELGASVSQSAFDNIANGRLLDWLNEREEHFRYVIYECDLAPTAWTSRCLRQADLVLAVAQATDDPEPGAAERAFLHGVSADGRAARYELVLLHPSDAAHPVGTARWLDARAGAVRAHHHVRISEPAHLARLARSITGTSLGLVMSGGGARGFASLGVMRALHESGLDVDVVGGTSMGAVLAGLCAMGHDVDAMIEVARRGFCGFEVFSDLTAPVVSLMRGASSVKMLKAMFGDVQIEDLWIPYFCVSSNMTRAEVVVHDRGPIWFATRASSSIPGILPPVPWRGDLLVDGGVLNNLPADIMRDRCRGSVVAVDVGAVVELRSPLDDAPTLSGWPQLARTLNPLAPRPAFPNILRILSRTATLGSVHDQAAMQEVADLYLHPPTDAVDPLDWAAIDTVVGIGYRHARTPIAEWKHAGNRAANVADAIRRSSIQMEKGRP